MPTIYIDNVRIVRPGIGIDAGSLLIKDGKIAALDSLHDALPSQCERIDGHGTLLSPGLIDVHTHGVFEFLFERSPEDLIRGVEALTQFGTTCVLPTLYRVLDRHSLNKLELLADALGEVDGIAVPGFHLEGPFLALPGAGAATIPGDLGLLDELLAATHDRVRAMSVSPDCPNILPVIERLRELGISTFITHTRASVSETEAAVLAGARHATHFYDVFPVPAEVEPGVRPVGAVEVLLANRQCTVDFICDGIHVDPAAIRLAVAAKGPRGVIAITDSNIGAGVDEGVFETPWGFSVTVHRHDAARVHDPHHPLCGQLAGSTLTMNRGIENLLRWLNLPAHEVWAMGSSNPARILGLANKGTMQVGADADLVLWNEENGRLQVAQTWVSGRSVYQCEPTYS